MDDVQLGYYNYPFIAEAMENRMPAMQAVIPPGSNIVDLGCNDGRISLVLIGSGHAASSLGIDFTDIRLAAPPEFSFIAADLRSFDLRTLPEVDVILCLNVIHHMCVKGLDFARDFMAELARHAGTVICDLGSQTEDTNAHWKTIFKAEWANDFECWADLFQSYRWRRPLLTYPAWSGRRVTWKLVSDREPPYSFDLLGQSSGVETTIRLLNRTGTHELFWAKSYNGERSDDRHRDIRGEIHKRLAHAPYDCFLPLASHAEYGDIYAHDSELAEAKGTAAAGAMGELSPEQYREFLTFGAQTVPALGDYPLDLLCDLRVARTSRGLTFFHFEPSGLALKLLSQG